MIQPGIGTTKAQIKDWEPHQSDDASAGKSIARRDQHDAKRKHLNAQEIKGTTERIGRNGNGQHGHQWAVCAAGHDPPDLRQAARNQPETGSQHQRPMNARLGRPRPNGQPVQRGQANGSNAKQDWPVPQGHALPVRNRRRDSCCCHGQNSFKTEPMTVARAAASCPASVCTSRKWV